MIEPHRAAVHDGAIAPRLAAIAHSVSVAQHQSQLKLRYLAQWKLMKRARFNAAKRLERKASAGLVTLALVALYGGLISVFNLMFKHRIGADTRDILEYVAVVSMWLTLIIGLTEQQKGHAAAARELHDCAREINDLQKQLAATHVQTEAEMRPFLDRYGDVVARCRQNHDDVDFELARQSPSREERVHAAEPPASDSDQPGTWWSRQVRLRYHVATYWFYAVIATTPMLVGAGLWLMLPTSPRLVPFS